LGRQSLGEDLGGDLPKDGVAGVRRRQENQGQEALHPCRYARPSDAHAADMQDRDGGALVTAPLFGIFPFLLKLYADGGYDRSILRRTLKKAMSELNVEIVKRSDMPSRYVPARNCHRSAATVMVSAGLHFQKASD